jgi:probable F420-dependent oxidoreductase
VKLSLWPRNNRAPADLLEEVRTADANGWYGVWLADHYMPDTGDTRPARGDIYECWALLPALAAVTERVRLGTLVSPTSVHHPALLANRAATLDQLSGGRLVLGLGAGWQLNEHHAYGIELEPPGKRVSRFSEAIQIVRSLLAEDSTTFHGEFYDFTDAPCDPKPVQSPLPLLVGTKGPRMLRITARYASEWNTWSDPDLAGRRQRLLEACETTGRDPATVWTSVNALIDFGGSAAPPGRTIAGSAQQLIDQLGWYTELGFDEFILPDWNLGAGHAERADNVARIKAEVLDQLPA